MRDQERVQQPRIDYLLVLILTLPALYPLLGTAMFASHDGLHHLFRIFELDYTLRGGALFPRWFPHLGFGYGYPVLNYYAPLAYYLALPFISLGSGAILATKILYALGFCGAALAMYALSRPFLGRAGAVLAAAAYTYIPYHLADAFVRGALPEFLALSLVPFILWSSYRSIAEDSAAFGALFGLGLAGLALTHNLSVILAAPLIAGFAICVASLTHRWSSLRWVALATLAATLLTAFYWLPALAEVNAIRASEVSRQPGLLLAQLTSLPDLVSPYFLYRYMPNQGRVIEHPVGLVAGILALASAVAAILRWRGLLSLQRGWIVLCGIAVAGSTFMMLTSSAMLWRLLPGLSYLQFTWRWQLILTFGLAGLLGSASIVPLSPARRRGERPNRAQWSAVVVLTAGLAVAGLINLPREAEQIPEHAAALHESDLSLEGMAAYEYQLFLASREWQAPWSFEYLPASVQEDPRELILPPAAVTGADPAEGPPLEFLQVTRQAPLRLDLRAVTAAETSLRLHTFDFPGWAARVDGRSADVYPSTSLGLLTLKVPAGDHEIAIRYGMTPARWIGLALSLLTLVGIFAWLILSGRRRLVASMLIATIVVAGVWGWHSQERTILLPESSWVNFGNQFALVGYAIATPKQLGDPMTVDLWWLSLAQPVEDYKVFVHFDDASGRRWAQHDAGPAFNLSPTTRWAQNELVWDRHTLALPTDLPAGDFSIYVGLYDAQSLINLDLLDSMNNPQGNRFLLRIVQMADYRGLFE